MKGFASAPGKVILFGEHFILYGCPAISMAINLYSNVIVKPRKDKILRIFSKNLNLERKFFERKSKGHEAKEGEGHLEPVRIAAGEVLKLASLDRGLNIEVDSQIPPAAGLGSSAAIAVSTIASVAKLFELKLTKDEIRGLAFPSERFVHGNPSGIDQTTSTFGGIICYEPKSGFRKIGANAEFKIVIGDSGISRSTKEQIAKVKAYMDQHKDREEKILSEYKLMVSKAINAIKTQDMSELGYLMNENQRLLKEVGASSPILDAIVERAIVGGALGAKLTGAGGGGCAIALVTERTEEKVMKEVLKVSKRAYLVNVDWCGVRSKKLD
ncbi:TPA: mevalonate kinase [Candidatus Bathyarchaeota archaeon]|nr:mevalonate kinase [Candidatus Bathyarchaeota archaeon]